MPSAFILATARAQILQNNILGLHLFVHRKHTTICITLMLKPISAHCVVIIKASEIDAIKCTLRLAVSTYSSTRLNSLDRSFCIETQVQLWRFEPNELFIGACCSCTFIMTHINDCEQAIVDYRGTTPEKPASIIAHNYSGRVLHNLIFTHEHTWV